MSENTRVERRLLESSKRSFGWEYVAECPPAFSWGIFMRMLIIAVAASVALGTALSPAAGGENASGGKLKQIMERNDRLVQLSQPDCRKPPLILLHGATDDPTEMMAIAREWRNDYNTFLFSYNYHKPVEKIAADFVKELETLKTKGALSGDATVIGFSYGAMVFREGVILSPDSSLFTGSRVIQLVPTAGGSFFARGMQNRLAAFVISMASKPAAAANPFGEIARQVWDGAGNQKFYSVIDPTRMQTILVEDDANSVSRIQDKDVQRRYKNGIGENVIVVPRSAGVSHEYFPVEPAGLEYLRKVMEAPTMRANAEKRTIVGLNSRSKS
jgi:pimeloyl-ACP methyl ester carboxylesterase